ncbi:MULTISPECIES: hypothetical protein [Polyangium]|uniref:Uncharacterized protein n=1 Tax=Polyangium sorediatum TaxID=889274 RepID=A0ABT6NVF5_9BACT|nr:MULTISPECIES: hypothetical protein [Polyangium]MDI1432327.1 hypothetical protein [Polyangium sorediatum]
MSNPQRPPDRGPRRSDPGVDDPRTGPDSQPPTSTSFSGVIARGFDAVPISVRGDRVSPPSVPSSRLPPSSGTMPTTSGPSSTPASGQPSSGVRRTKGGIYQAVRLLDQKHGSFFISRLILVTGVNLRSFDSSSVDEPVVAEKLIKALRPLLSPAELDGLMPLLVAPQR